MDEWKIERRKRGCAGCGREFESEEVHRWGSGLAAGGLGGSAACLRGGEPPLPAGGDAPFSFWKTTAPKRGKRRLEDVGAMVEFFKKLLERKHDDPLYEKV